MDGIHCPDNILGYPSKLETLVNELISTVLEYDIDGINLDFEMITEDGADNYIQFVRGAFCGLPEQWHYVFSR